MTAEEEVLAELEDAVTAWEKGKAEAEWKDAMRVCLECKAWVNRHMRADVVALCPRVNLCHLREGYD